MKEEKWENKILRMTSRPKMKEGEGWVVFRKRTSREMEAKRRMITLPTMAETNAKKVWKTMTWAIYEGDVPVLKAPRSILR